MLDIKRIRQNPEEVKAAVERRGKKTRIDELLSEDEKRRQILADAEAKKAKKNEVSKKIPAMKKAGEDTAPIFEEMKKLGDEIKKDDDKLSQIDATIKEILLSIPNTPNPDIPDGLSDADNVEVKKFMEPTKFEYEPKAHWDIGTDLDIIDPETAASVTGARFTFYKGLGARLERASTTFMLDVHTGGKRVYRSIPPLYRP